MWMTDLVCGGKDRVLLLAARELRDAASSHTQLATRSTALATSHLQLQSPPFRPPIVL
jgi:hypothetical protein